ncbi:outer membrane protein assembly factor BamC [Rheinheimera sp. SM2107]|uniref:Outer membrane protein assembly factor BamC n=1 Tax=Arsukibacterium indicum TaxID=2848612 RepID=A0ABS6MQM3_9GAMM|nr:outer membrane protein assembly factor BamC [Arsukibacterium indicum]
MSLATVLLSGCSVFKDEPDSRVQRQQVTLDIPADLATPRQPGKYDIPQSDMAVGDVAETSPVLVLATASSSRITDESEKLARVMFERNDLTGDLIPFLQTQLTNYFSAQDIQIKATDDANLNFETGWIKRYRSEGFWLWQDEQQLDEARYTISIEPRPHGRTAIMSVSLLEHRFFDKQAQLTKAAARDSEVKLLNSLINQVAVSEIETAVANRDRVPEVDLEPGLNSAGEPAFITPQSIDVTWSQLEPVFEQLNFTVNDINRSAFTYYVSYSKPGRGMWATMMGREAPPVLPIADSDYQIVLQRSAEGTVINLLTKEGKPLAADVIVAAYDPFVAAIRAAKVEL